MPTDPEAICIALRPHVSAIARIGIEARSTGIRLARGLCNEGLPVTVVEARHMRSALSTMRNKTDRNDAHGIAQIMRMGWFPALHVKPLETQRLKTFLANRRLLKRNLIDLQNHLRGALRTYGLKVGRANVHLQASAQTAQELVNVRPDRGFISAPVDISAINSVRRISAQCSRLT